MKLKDIKQLPSMVMEVTKSKGQLGVRVDIRNTLRKRILWELKEKILDNKENAK
jgi:hypothetical protein